jgi:hypothetical protein
MNNLSKLYFVLILFLITLVSSNGQQEAAKLSRKLLFSIGEGEKAVFSESSIALSPIGNSVIVLTSDDEGRIYVYDNGKKRGPFKDINETGVTLPEVNPEEYDPILRRVSDTDYEKYITYNDSGEVTLKFGSKSYGPFQFILEFYSTNDKTAFSAIVMKDRKPQIISSTGIKVVLDGQPTYNWLSPSGKKLMVTTVKENNVAGELLSRDMSKMSSDEIARLGKEMAGKQVKPPEAYVCFQDGKKYGPFDPKKITASNPAFEKTGGENWLLTMDSKLYINGVAVKDLLNEHLSPANVWLTQDGKRYVIIVYNRIEFNDGSIFKDPLRIRISIAKNKITIWWLLLENEKDIVLYSKTI